MPTNSKCNLNHFHAVAETTHHIFVFVSIIVGFTGVGITVFDDELQRAIERCSNCMTNDKPLLVMMQTQIIIHLCETIGDAKCA